MFFVFARDASCSVEWVAVCENRFVGAKISSTHCEKRFSGRSEIRDFSRNRKKFDTKVNQSKSSKWNQSSIGLKHFALLVSRILSSKAFFNHRSFHNGFSDFLVSTKNARKLNFNRIKIACEELRCERSLEEVVWVTTIFRWWIPDEIVINCKTRNVRSTTKGVGFVLSLSLSLLTSLKGILEVFSYLQRTKLSRMNLDLISELSHSRGAFHHLEARKSDPINLSRALFSSLHPNPSSKQ